MALNMASAEDANRVGITELARNGFEIRASLGPYLFLQNKEKVFICSQRVPDKLFISGSAVSEDEIVCLPVKAH